MKITLHRPNVEVALGHPAVEIFDLTPRQLRAWNSLQHKLDGVSYNENWNKTRGLPEPAARRWLNSLHFNRFGGSDPSAPLTWADVRKALS
jgi:hypothetical protein